MALAIKAIPTLYGKEARRFREMAEEVERKYDMRPKRDIKKKSDTVLCAKFLIDRTLIINIGMAFLEENCILDVLTS